MALHQPPRVFAESTFSCRRSPQSQQHDESILNDLSRGTLELSYIPKESQDANTRTEMLSSWSPNNPSFGFPKVPSITTKTEERICKSVQEYGKHILFISKYYCGKIADEVYAKRTHPSQ